MNTFPSKRLKQKRNNPFITPKQQNFMSDEKPAVPLNIFEESNRRIEEIQRTLRKTDDCDAREILKEAPKIYAMAIKRCKKGCGISAYDREKNISQLCNLAILPLLIYQVSLSFKTSIQTNK